jgi:hypothetical protein
MLCCSKVLLCIVDNNKTVVFSSEKNKNAIQETIENNLCESVRRNQYLTIDDVSIII